MTINARKMGILSRLIQADSYVPIKDLMDGWNISRHTVYRDIKGINTWLERQNLQHVRRFRRAGFYLEPAEKSYIKEKLGRQALKREYYKSPEERVAWMGVLLLTREKPVFLQDLIEKLKVSKRTILRDKKILKAELNPYRLELRFEKYVGYHITGAEQDKRRILVQFMDKIHPIKESNWLKREYHLPVEIESNWTAELFASPDASAIYRILFESERFLEVHYPDEMIEILSIHLLFLLKRYRQGKMVHMDPVEKVILKPTAEYRAARYIGERMEEAFMLAIPEDELCYITVCLMGAKTEEYCPSLSNETKLVLLKSIIEKMVTDFENDCRLVFRNRDVLERSLYFHLKSAYYRIIYGLEYENPLAETIITNHPTLFKETKKVIHHLEQAIGKNISNDEIALITMHFGGWIERAGA